MPDMTRPPHLTFLVAEPMVQPLVCVLLQVYVNSEFIGGCDIMIEAYQDGSLKEMLEVAASS